MHEQPRATEEEQEQVQKRQGEEESMRQAGHDDPRTHAEEEDGDE